jgi:hypothetical protein
MSIQLDNQAPRLIDQGPLILFDFHLGLLSESYLTFFQERYERPVLLLHPELIFRALGRRLRRIS